MKHRRSRYVLIFSLYKRYPKMMHILKHVTITAPGPQI